MLETVSQGFKNARNFLQGQAQLTEDNIDTALKEVRRSLLEADVEYSVVKGFMGRVKDKAMGEIITVRTKSKAGKKVKLSPSEHFIGFCYDELEALMGPVDTEIRLSRPVGTIMMVGLDLISSAAFFAFSIISFPPCPCTVKNPKSISFSALIAL